MNMLEAAEEKYGKMKLKVHTKRYSGFDPKGFEKSRLDGGAQGGGLLLRRNL